MYVNLSVCNSIFYNAAQSCDSGFSTTGYLYIHKILSHCIRAQFQQIYTYSLWAFKQLPIPKRQCSAEERDEECDEETYKESITKINEELEKEKPKRKKLKALMSSTFAGRRHWITTNRPLVPEIIQTFPLLKTPKYVSQCIHL